MTQIPKVLETEVNDFKQFLSSPFSQTSEAYECIETRFDSLNLLTQRLEREACHTQDDLLTFQEWFRQQTDSVFLNSPITARARLWPEGYPGDYRTLECIYANRSVGQSVAYNIDRYFLSRTLAVAVRSRLRKLSSLLKQRAFDEDIEACWLNLACGPCRELLALNPCETARVIYCVDTDTNALEYAKDLISGKNIGRVEFLRENAFRFLNAKRVIENYGQFTTIYSAGLFDYIKSDHLTRLVAALFGCLKETGVFIVPFKDCRRYTTFDYHWVVKWHFFFQRTYEHFMRIFADAGVPHNAITVERDDSGVILFFILRKSK